MDVKTDNIQAEAGQDSFRVLANDASVASNTDLFGYLRDGTAHNDNLSSIARNCGCEGSIR